MTLVYLIAGEASGDLLGGRLMRAMKTMQAGLHFAGIGGDLMIEEGLVSNFPMAELSVMGVVEVVKHLPRLLRRIRETSDDIVARHPDVVVTIDAPDFCFRVARRVKACAPDIRFVHYVAPSVWAWRPKRAAKIARFLDHILCLLPFEPPYFEREGLRATFVGHPLVENNVAGDAVVFRTAHQIDAGVRVVLLLPGSRRSEIARMLPILVEAARLLMACDPGLRFVVPTITYLQPEIETLLLNSIPTITVVAGEVEKRNAFAAASLAIATSGTVTLELAMAGVPSVVGYKASLLTYLIGSALVKIVHFALPNIIVDRKVVPELLQYACTPEAIAAQAWPLLDAGPARQAQLDQFAAIVAIVTPPKSPSVIAAKVIAGVAGIRSA